jgi:acyl-coenzyme A synthetase/AMP-(fatty) acid ligase
VHGRYRLDHGSLLHRLWAGPLALAASSVVYEGLPTYPDAGRPWRIAEELERRKLSGSSSVGLAGRRTVDAH